MTTKKKTEPRKVLLTAGQALRLVPMKRQADEMAGAVSDMMGAILKAHGIEYVNGWTLNIGRDDVELVEILPDE